MTSMEVISPKILHLSIATNKAEFPYQVRYPATMALVEFKIKLELVVGIYAQDMRLELRSAEGKFLAELIGDDRTLEELGVIDNSIVHVQDLTGNSSASGHLPQDASSTAAVPHYVMPDEKYDNRKESVRKWKQELLAAQASSSPNDDAAAIPTNKIPNTMQVGKQCVVQLRGQPRRFAKIAFVGPTHFGANPGQECWVGVIYEEAVGKNDGSLDGKRYFSCKSGHGGFVKPHIVEVLEEDGHFPESEKQEPMEEI